MVQDAKMLIGPGETYDFEFEPKQAGQLTLEFKGTALPVKVAQEIEVE